MGEVNAGRSNFILQQECNGKCNGRIPPNPDRPDRGTNKCRSVPGRIPVRTRPEAITAYIRYDAVMNALPRIPNMTKKDASYLVGRLSGRDKLHESHHRLGIRAMAVYLERLSKQWMEERKVALLKAFTWLTGYSNYSNAYNNEAEKRQFSDRGIQLALSSIFQMESTWRTKKKGMH